MTDKFDKEKYQYLQELIDLAGGIQSKVTDPEYRSSDSYKQDIDKLIEHFVHTIARLMGNKPRELTFDITERVKCAFKKSLENPPLE